MDWFLSIFEAFLKRFEAFLKRFWSVFKGRWRGKSGVGKEIGVSTIIFSVYLTSESQNGVWENCIECNFTSMIDMDWFLGREMKIKNRE